MKSSLKITLLVTIALFCYAASKKSPNKAKVDIRVVRSPYPHYETTSPYVLNPSYYAKAEESQNGQDQGSHQQVSVLSEAQYEVLLKQAQKALRGYDLSKLTATTKPAVEYSKPTEAPKAQPQPQVAIKYVYADVPTAAAYYPSQAASYASDAYSKVEEEQHGYEHYSKHKFGYRVHDPHTGAAFGHSEISEGHVTRGHYHVLLPDGRLQNVKYVADPSGYHATVTYESYKQYQ